MTNHQIVGLNIALFHIAAEYNLNRSLRDRVAFESESATRAAAPGTRLSCHPFGP
jgi:hypothetical protein